MTRKRKSSMIMTRLNLFLTFFLALISWQPRCQPVLDIAGGTLLFKTGFEEGVEVSGDMSCLTGSDIPGCDWENTPSWIASSRFVYLARNVNLSDYMETRIETQPGPFGESSRVLRMINKADVPDDGHTSRNEFSFFGKEPPDDYREGYVRYWMKFQGNLNDLVPFEQASPFYMIMEWKEPNSGKRKSAEECEACCNAGAGGTNNYRINVRIIKEAHSDEFIWAVTGEHPQPCRKQEWRHENAAVGVPLGDWFLVEAYMKKDDTDGRVYFAVNEQVVLDTDVTRPRGFTGRTQHADNPLPLRFWSPLKNYHHMNWNREGPVSHWYDDFELWSSFPPGHPALKVSNE